MADNYYIYEDIVALGMSTFSDDGTGNDWLVLSGDYGGTRSNPGAFLILSNFKYSNHPGPTDFAYAFSLPSSLAGVLIYGGIENAMGGAGAEVIFGSDLANILQGDPDDVAGGADALNGFDGDDTLIGMGGSDLLQGDNGNDLMYGDANPFVQGGNVAQGDDTLTGGAGNDTMFGGWGNNTLYGGDGYDTGDYTGFFDDFGNTSYRMVAYNWAGMVTVYASDTATGTEYVAATDTISGVEVLWGTANGDRMEARFEFAPGDFPGDEFHGGGGRDTLYGSIGVDAIYGGEDADFLWDGGNSQPVGADLLNGGNGNDYYTVSSDRTIILETATGGYDYVMANFNYTLPAYVEHLYLNPNDPSVLIGTGNALNNQLEGNKFANELGGLAGDDNLFGFEGNDTLRGGLGDDSLYGGTDADDLNGGDRNDVLYGEDGTDSLYGGNQDDMLFGGTRNDFLQGGTGHDELRGGGGADTFYFATAAEAGKGRSHDIIGDFHSGQDVIDLHHITKRQVFIDSNPFHAAGKAEIRYDSARSLIIGDTNGDGIADYQISLGAGTVLAASDLLL
ncbi:MAG: calcium-binding protein [bacterium]